MITSPAIKVHIDFRTWCRSRFSHIDFATLPFLGKYIGVGQGPKEFLYRLASCRFEQINFTPFLTKSDAYLCNAMLSESTLVMLSSLDIPLITRLDGVGFDNYSLDVQQREFVKERISKTVSASEGLIFQSEFAKTAYESAYDIGPRENVIIANGLTPKNHVAIEKRVKSEKPVLIVGGRTSPRKRIENTIRCFIDSPYNNDALLKVIGDVTPIRHSSVHFLGRLSPQNLFSELLAAQGLIHLDWYDWCPNLVIEDLVAKTPVLSGNVGGTPELVKDSGVCVDLDDPVPEFNTTHLTPVPDIQQEAFNTGLGKFMDYIHVDMMAEREDLFINNVARKYEDFIIGQVNAST